VPELRELGFRVIEDAARAAGATLGGTRSGALGDAATFSFFPSKNHPCLGDGGAIATDDDGIAEQARILSFHGKKYHTEIGYNSRLDELEAAVLRALLRELDGWNRARRRAARAYEEAGLGEHVTLPAATTAAEQVFHLYVTLASDPDALVQCLDAGGVEARGYYRTPVHRQPAMERFAAGELPITDRAAAANVALPMGTELTAVQVDAVVAACRPRVAA